MKLVRVNPSPTDIDDPRKYAEEQASKHLNAIEDMVDTEDLIGEPGAVEYALTMCDVQSRYCRNGSYRDVLINGYFGKDDRSGNS